MDAIEKRFLRRDLRARRRLLSPSERERAVADVLRHMRAKNLWRLGSRWAFYLPFGSEFDCRALMAVAQKLGKELYLPLTAKFKDGKLVFVRVDRATKWRRSRLGMLEPVSKRFISARGLDVVCMPLLGFDKGGGRLGQGGGFYDRTFAFRRQGLHKPLLVGLAFACQEVHSLPMEPWDVRLDWIVTESAAIKCKERACAIG